MVELLSDDITRLPAAPVKIAGDDGLHWGAVPAEKAWGTGPSFSKLTSASPSTESAESVPCPEPWANTTCSLRRVTLPNPVSQTDEAYSLTLPTLDRGDAVMYRLRRAGALHGCLRFQPGLQEYFQLFRQPLSANARLPNLPEPHCDMLWTR